MKMVKYIGSNYLLEKALGIAISTHSDQVDFGDNPIIEHVIRVYSKALTWEEKAVSLLHDVLEDSDAYDARMFLSYGFPVEVVDAVVALTRKDDEDYLTEYMPRVLSNRLASRVKLIDLEDNMNICRVPSLDHITDWQSIFYTYSKSREMILKKLNGGE